MAAPRPEAGGKRVVWNDLVRELVLSTIYRAQNPESFMNQQEGNPEGSLVAIWRQVLSEYKVEERKKEYIPELRQGGNAVGAGLQLSKLIESVISDRNSGDLEIRLKTGRVKNNPLRRIFLKAYQAVKARGDISTNGRRTLEENGWVMGESVGKPVHLSDYIPQVVTELLKAQRAPNPTEKQPFLQGLKRTMSKMPVDWGDPSTLENYIRSLTMPELYDLMVGIGYQWHHLIPADTFNLSRAFREYYEYVPESMRILFNMESRPGAGLQEQMRNGVFVLRILDFKNGERYGVHNNHPVYNDVIARYLDWRLEDLVKREAELLFESGGEYSESRVEHLAQQRLASEIPQILGSLKGRILEGSVIGEGNRYLEN